MWMQAVNDKALPPPHRFKGYSDTFDMVHILPQHLSERW